MKLRTMSPQPTTRTTASATSPTMRDRRNRCWTRPPVVVRAPSLSEACRWATRACTMGARPNRKLVMTAAIRPVGAAPGVGRSLARRHPDLGAFREIETGRHHPDHFDRVGVDGDGTADDI